MDKLSVETWVLFCLTLALLVSVILAFVRTHRELQRNQANFRAHATKTQCRVMKTAMRGPQWMAVALEKPDGEVMLFLGPKSFLKGDISVGDSVLAWHAGDDVKTLEKV